MMGLGVFRCGITAPFSPALALNLAFEGDSITAGFSVTSLRSFANMYGATANLAVTSSRIEGAAPSLANRVATLDALIDPTRRNVLVVMTGNDLFFGDSVSTMLGKMSSYLDARYAAGWQYIIIWTILPRTAAAAPGFNALRNTANTTIRTWVGTHCDVVVDFDLTTMGPDAAASDTSLYGDGVHPTLAGQRLLYAPIAAALDAIAVPSTDAPTTDLVEHWKLNTGLTQAAGVASAWAGIRRGLALTASGTAQPAVQGDGSLLFDGSTDKMVATFACSLDGYTIFLLAKQVTWTNTDCIMDGKAVYTGALFQYSSTPGLQTYDGSTFSSQNNGWAVNTWAVVAYTQAANGVPLIQIDAGTATTGAGLTPKNLQGLTLGANGSGTQPANIQIKELLLYRGALDSTARAAVRSYLATVP